MPTVLSVLGTLQLPGGGKAFEELTTSSMKRFNKDYPNVEGIMYYSYGARCQPGLLDAFRMSWGIIKLAGLIQSARAAADQLYRDVEGDNDGLVSVESAIWGKVRFSTSSHSITGLKDESHSTLEH